MKYILKNINVLILFSLSFNCVSQLDTIAVKYNEVNIEDQGLSLFDLENRPLDDGVYFVYDEGESKVSFGKVIQGKKNGLWLSSSMQYDDKVLEYYFGDTCLTIVANIDFNIKFIDIRKIEKDTVQGLFDDIFSYNEKSLFRMGFRVNENNGVTFDDFAIEFYSIRIDDLSYISDRFKRFSYYAIIRKYFE